MGNATLLDLAKVDDTEAGALVREAWTQGKHILVYASGFPGDVTAQVGPPPPCEHGHEEETCVACGDEVVVPPPPGAYLTINVATGLHASMDAEILRAASQAAANTLAKRAL